MENPDNFQFPLYPFTEAVKSILIHDQVLGPLITGVHYRIAPSNAEGEFVIQQMKSGVLAGAGLETLGGTTGARLQWQLEAVASDRDGKSAMWWCDAIARRICLMFDRNEAIFEPYLAPLGLYCERSKAISLVPPSLQSIAGAQKWRYGHVYEWLIEPMED